MTKSSTSMTKSSTSMTKKELEGFKEIHPRSYKKIQPGEYVRYSINNEIRKGGFVRKTVFQTTWFSLITIARSRGVYSTNNHH